MFLYPCGGTILWLASNLKKFGDVQFDSTCANINIMAAMGLTTVSQLSLVLMDSNMVIKTC